MFAGQVLQRPLHPGGRTLMDDLSVPKVCARIKNGVDMESDSSIFVHQKRLDRKIATKSMHACAPIVPLTSIRV